MKRDKRIRWLSVRLLVLALSTAAGSASGQNVPRIAAQRMVIGLLDGATDQVFGEIADLKVDERGNIYVLDGDPFPQVLVHVIR